MVIKDQSNAATAALRSFYVQSSAPSYNLDEALEALLTLTVRSKRAFILECQKKLYKLS